VQYPNIGHVVALIDPVGPLAAIGADTRKDGRNYRARHSRRAPDGAAEFSTYASVHRALLLLLFLLHPCDRSRYVY
jgi:hypothetical protein